MSAYLGHCASSSAGAGEGTLTACSQGRSTCPGARAISEATEVLDGLTAAAVQARVLPKASQQTVGELRTALSRAVLPPTQTPPTSAEWTSAAPTSSPTLGRDVHGEPQTTVEVQVNLDAATLARLADTPGHLAGYGPIPAEMARELSAAARRWRAALIDEQTGQLKGLSVAYRPRPLLDLTVHAQDTTRCFPVAANPSAGVT